MSLMWLCVAFSLLTFKAVALRFAPTQQTQQIPYDLIEDDWVEDEEEFAIPGLVQTVDKSKMPVEQFDLNANPAWCNRSRYILPSLEDRMDKKQSTCSSAHVPRGVEYDEKFPYGRLVSLNGNLWFYVEIPKTGSSTVKKMISESIVPYNNATYTSEQDVAGIKAFMFTRHPITRFVSGYGTIMNRACGKNGGPQEWKTLCQMDEPVRFSTFVRIFAERGTGILDMVVGVDAKSWVMFHVFSSTWFRNFWPGPINFIGQVETFADSLADFNKLTGMSFKLPHSNRNEGGINQTMLLQQTAAIQTLHGFFHDEIKSFGYAPLDLKALAGAEE